jgi:hypothetical protein
MRLVVCVALCATAIAGSASVARADGTLRGATAPLRPMQRTPAAQRTAASNWRERSGLDYLSAGRPSSTVRCQSDE